MSAQTATAHLFRFGKLVFVVIACMLLVVLSVQGFGNALRNVNDLQSPAQYLMTVSQFLYSALGPCVVVLRLVRHRWLRAAWKAWASFLMAAVTLIPWAWIGSFYLTTLGFAAIGVACAGAICFLMLLGTHPFPEQDVPLRDS
jgi:hypothetical protein